MSLAVQSGTLIKNVDLHQCMHSNWKAIYAVTEMKTWMCLICGWIYDEATGDSEHGVAPGTAWRDVPVNWTCPECGARKEDFEMVAI
jgi:rubredoxin